MKKNCLSLVIFWNSCRHWTILADISSIIGKKDLTDRNAVVSIQTPEIDMSQVAWQLDNEYGVMTRVGLHCAPSAHKTLGTYPAGTIRFSFGPENTKNELDFAIQGLKKILDL